MSRPGDFKFDPHTGGRWHFTAPAMHADAYRVKYPRWAWRFNPWTGIQRSLEDLAENPFMENVAPPFPPIEPHAGVLTQESSAGHTHMPTEHPCVIDSVPKFVEADPTGRTAHTPGAKMDAGKARVWLCVSGFSRALGAVAEVTTRGAEKYAPNSWMEVPDGVDRYMEGFARHALAVGRGETHDTGQGGTGCLHKAQMIWNLLASLELELRRDDGWSRGS